MLTVNGEPIYKVGSNRMQIRERVFDVCKFRDYIDPQTGVRLFPTPLVFVNWALAMMNEEAQFKSSGYMDEATDIARTLDSFEL